MRSKVRTIDPSLDLGLHELANSGEGRARPDGSFRFQLKFAKEQTEDILLNLDNLVKNTIDKAPVRTKDFCLDRTTAPELTHEEDKWEREMYLKWGPRGSGEYVSVCKRIQAYQYPLQASRKDRCWGKIDLLGIGTDFLPVPNELKKRKSNESPLRMLVEVSAYGFAIRKVWPKLRDDWVKAVRRSGGSPSQFPPTLDRVTLIGVAPDEYWSSCLGLLGANAGAFPSEAWPPFWKLVDALGRWFDIYFVAINKGSWDDTKGSLFALGSGVAQTRTNSLDNQIALKFGYGTEYGNDHFPRMDPCTKISLLLLRSSKATRGKLSAETFIQKGDRRLNGDHRNSRDDEDVAHRKNPHEKRTEKAG